MKSRHKIQILTLSAPREFIGWALVWLFAASITVMLLVERVRPEAMQPLKSIAVDVVRPAAEVIAAPKHAIASMAHNASAFIHTYRDNKQLKQDNAALLQWQTAARELQLENQQLRALLHVVPDAKAHYISTRMISDMGAASSITALIGAGQRDGVQKHQAVISPQGLIGRVIEVGERSARVLLLADSNSHIPVVGELGRHKAIVSGRGREALALHYIEHGDQFIIGERLVTSGDGGMLPAGIPVASITSVNGITVMATPLSNAAATSMVTVVDYQF